MFVASLSFRETCQTNDKTDENEKAVTIRSLKYVQKTYAFLDEAIFISLVARQSCY
jgi:hypothetical protein